ncbi:nuclear transport factor 2 family protein [Pimelobacter simplex]|uniref:nuclear transport factor 2 family protein n=1 Tax=Nocardioides simplex TaxID=2045 RepID=UPI0021505220|nr:nuclear transport factor 2 family protein [Pimelobacter simplex]UUW87285.1 nuclear transport factor 2 family protein [Pimelobacter simplex]UUW96791.1 nuclear transport factor 2 family protein [Pimelobacter simplex]
MSAFRAAVEARDVEAMRACLAEDVVFRSPVAHKPYPGKAITGAILAHVIEVFEDFRYVRELGDDTGHALVFEATVGGLELTGCDFLVLDEDGLITEFMVMVRPLKAAQALAEAMAARFEAIVELAAQG